MLERPAVILSAAALALQAPSQAGGEAGSEEEADAPGDERVAESYDDAEFYQQLLKEFLEGSAAAGAHMQSFGQARALASCSHVGARCCAGRGG